MMAEAAYGPIRDLSQCRFWTKQYDTQVNGDMWVPASDTDENGMEMSLAEIPSNMVRFCC
jgi:hypothetical protein